MYQYNAELKRVIDGDTIVALVDLGFSTWKKVNIRFYGIDAYENRTRDKEEKIKGIAAKNRVVDVLEAAGGKFVLESKGADKYGRCLGIIHVRNAVGNLSNLNELLITEGHAVRYE